MKTILLSLIIAVLISTATVVGQDINNDQPVVKTAVYFDKTPPLRDMKIVVAGDRDRSWKDDVIGIKMRASCIPTNNPYPLIKCINRKWVQEVLRGRFTIFRG